MKNDHIPLLSYVFIGITSLVLTYATISDTTGEIINPSPNAPTSPNDSSSKSLFSMSGSVDKIKSMITGSESTQTDRNVSISNTTPNDSSSKSLNSMSGFIDKLKTMVIGEETTKPVMNVPVATPAQSTIEKPTFGGKNKNKNRKPNFTKRNKSKK